MADAIAHATAVMADLRPGRGHHGKPWKWRSRGPNGRPGRMSER
jgi:hypothetical protein